MEYVQTYKYAANHVREIESLLDVIKYPNNAKLIFQSLPKHMRRRAMSHHPKRLPIKYRRGHISQMQKSGKFVQNQKSRSKCGKSQIRPHRRKGHLETHVWHAKRFRMMEKWGYKIAFSSYDKSYRACYRATSMHCLLQDISYYNCIEIIGCLELINEKFKLITNVNTGLGLCAKTFVSGKREGSITLYKKEKYPRDALGKVNFFWKSIENSELKHILWIWIHPSNYSEILEEIIKLFHLISVESLVTEENLPCYNNSTKKFENENKTLFLTELKHTLNRFRLTGPLSQSILLSSLKPKNLKDTTKSENNWFYEVMQNAVNCETHNKQSNFWLNFKPNDVYPNMIISLNVDDPRNHRPNKRTKVVYVEKENHLINFSNNDINSSFIWDYNIRTKISKTIISNNEYNKIRNKTVLVPTEKCSLEKDLQPIPILLIQNQGSLGNAFSRLGYGGGWDIIIPSGYGMIFWLSLIAYGAKPGGWRETQSIMKEAGKDVFLPDTISGKKEAGERSLILEQRYFKRPTSKRCNYNKLSIVSPFKAPLYQLIREWNPLQEYLDFFVLRDLEMLRNIENSLNRKNSFPELEPGCLIQISIEMKSRGNPGELSIVCIPRKVDLDNKTSTNPVYIEPIKNDENKSERTRIKIEHKKVLKRLKKSRIVKKIKDKKVLCDLKTKSRNRLDIIKLQYKKMCNLWVAKHPKSVRHQCSREVIGYITQCNYSFLNSKVTGIGYITAEGLKTFLQTFKTSKMILIRGTKTRNYRLATFKINLNL